LEEARRQKLDRIRAEMRASRLQKVMSKYDRERRQLAENHAMKEQIAQRLAATEQEKERERGRHREMINQMHRESKERHAEMRETLKSTKMELRQHALTPLPNTETILKSRADHSQRVRDHAAQRSWRLGPLSVTPTLL
jgi:hypothetical protein